MSWFQSAQAWIDVMREAHLARPVTYRRGQESVEARATLSPVRVQSVTADGAIVESHAVEAVMMRAALAGLYPPQPGDVLDDGARRYVVAIGPDGRSWRWSTDGAIRLWLTQGADTEP